MNDKRKAEMTKAAEERAAATEREAPPKTSTSADPHGQVVRDHA